LSDKALDVSHPGSGYEVVYLARPGV